MTTATAVPTPKEMRENVTEAKQDLADLHAVINAHETAKSQLLTRYNRLMAQHPDQFGPDGNAKKGTEAAKVSTELGQRNVRDFTEALQYAINKERQAEEALKRHRGEHVNLWIEEMKPDAEELVRKIHETAIELYELLGDYREMMNEALELAMRSGETRIDPTHGFNRTQAAIKGIKGLTLDQCQGGFAPLDLPIPPEVGA